MKHQRGNPGNARPGRLVDRRWRLLDADEHQDVLIRQTAQQVNLLARIASGKLRIGRLKKDAERFMTNLEEMLFPRPVPRRGA